MALIQKGFQMEKLPGMKSLKNRFEGAVFTTPRLIQALEHGGEVVTRSIQLFCIPHRLADVMNQGEHPHS